MVIADMPFGSYQESPAQAFHNAVPLMAAGAHMVKLEGGATMAPTIAFLAERGIPVCGHIGLTPQSVHQIGGYRVQGKGGDAAKQLHIDAHAVADAGARMVVVETVPADVGAEVTEAISIPTIGIGAGPHCSGQVLVLHDMLNVYPGRKARFVKNYLEGAGSVQEAVARYVAEVKDGTFPGPEHCF
jgi:3-methyl-2-oxobutanoate hydroxymethyltransferase